jgi:hypothetical protein
MKAVEPIVAADRNPKTELQEACDRLAQGLTFNADEKAEACERMDRMREENRRLFGETNLAVELIRQARDNA